MALLAMALRASAFFLVPPNRLLLRPHLYNSAAGTRNCRLCTSLKNSCREHDIALHILPGKF